jgi:hypothetical protein
VWESVLGADIERERTIISTSAGYIAQKKFYGEDLSEDLRKYIEFSANSDTDLVIELLQEMYSEDNASWFQARKHLYEQSVQLVDWHWKAIDTLAKALLGRSWEPRNTQTDADGKWSVDNREKWLHGIKVVEILKPFRINAFIVDDSVQSYSPKPHGNAACS